MPKLSGLLDYFPDLELLPLDKIIAGLNRREDPKLLTNELGNRILYPQIIPESERDFALDWAILQAFISIASNRYYDKNLNRFYISESFLARFPNLQHLVIAFIQAFHPKGIVTLIMKTESLGNKSLGTLLRPTILSDGGLIRLTVSGNKYDIKSGTLMAIRASGRRIDLKFESQTAQLVGKNNLLAEVPGGSLGLIIDTRRS